MKCPLGRRREQATIGNMELHSRAAVDRAMRVQEVILRAVAKKINCGGRRRRSLGLAIG